MIYLHVFLFISIIWAQSEDHDITISDFSYPDIENIHFIIDEGMQNTFFINGYHPLYMDDYLNNQVIIDGSLHLPQGSYVFPKLFSLEMIPDSIGNISQIHYHRGDYSLGELGISLQIRKDDGSYYSLHGLKKTPPIIYPSSSWNDDLQNYLLSYGNEGDDGSITLDVMYHLEDYHLPLTSEALDYSRHVESFHSGMKVKKQWGNIEFELHPAFQITNARRDGISTSYLTLWNNVFYKFHAGKKINIIFNQMSKWIMIDNENEMHEIENHLIKPKIEYVTNNLIFGAGMSILNQTYNPEFFLTLKNDRLFFGIDKKFIFYLHPISQFEFKKENIYKNTLSIGYMDKTYKVIFDIFQIKDSTFQYTGISTKIKMDFDWIELSQTGTIFNQRNITIGPIELFNHFSLFYSPNIWLWSKARFQPFFGIEMVYIKYSGMNIIDPTSVPIFTSGSLEEPYSSSITKMEFGLIVKRFKVSYQFMTSEIFGGELSNSTLTYPLDSIQNLSIEWQFWN